MAVPEPPLDTVGSCGGPDVQHRGQPVPMPLHAAWQAGEGGCSALAVHWEHPGPAGSLRPSSSIGQGCRYSAGPGIAGYCAHCQRSCSGLPIEFCSPSRWCCVGHRWQGRPCSSPVWPPEGHLALLCPSPAFGSTLPVSPWAAGGLCVRN